MARTLSVAGLLCAATSILKAAAPHKPVKESWPLRFKLEVDRKIYPEHAKIVLTSTVTNVSKQDVEIYPPGKAVFKGTMRCPRSSRLFGGRGRIRKKGQPMLLKAGQSVTGTDVLELSQIGNYYIDAEFKGLVRGHQFPGRIKAKRVQFRTVKQPKGYEERFRGKFGRLLAKFDKEFKARPTWRGYNGTLQGGVTGMGPGVAKYLIKEIEASTNRVRRELLYRPLVWVGSPDAIGFFQDRLLKGPALYHKTACRGLREIHLRRRAGDKALAVLLAALRTGGRARRRSVVATLALIHHPKTKQGMERALQDGDSKVREAAARYLAAAEWLPLADWLALAARQPTRARYLAARGVVADLERSWEIRKAQLPAASWDQASKDPKMLAAYRQALGAWETWARDTLPDSHRFFAQDRKHWPKRPAKRRPAARPERAPVGEVIHRTVNDMTVGTRCLLDLDTGKLLSAPKTPWESHKVERAWCEKKGVDLSILLGQVRNGAPTVVALCGANSALLPVTGDLWAAADRKSIDKATRHGRHSLPLVAVSCKADLPFTCLVVTDTDNLVVLQITSLVENRRAVKIRYRMLPKRKGRPRWRHGRAWARRLLAALPVGQQSSGGRLSILGASITDVFESFAAKGGFADMRNVMDSHMGTVAPGRKVRGDLRMQMLAAYGVGSPERRREIIRHSLEPIRQYVLDDKVRKAKWQGRYDGMLMLLTALGYSEALHHVVAAYHQHQAEMGNPIKASPAAGRWIPHGRGHNGFFMRYIDRAILDSAGRTDLPADARQPAAEYMGVRRRFESRPVIFAGRTYSATLLHIRRVYDPAVGVAAWWRRLEQLRTAAGKGATGAEPVDKARMRAAWEKLGSADAEVAFGAMFVLAGGGDRAAALVGEQLRLPPLNEAQIKSLIAQLDSDKFKARQTARRKLLQAGEVAAPALREALRQKLSAEARRAAGDLLSACEKGGFHTRRRTRTVRLLKRIGTPEARQALRKLAADSAPADTRDLAKKALEQWKSK